MAQSALMATRASQRTALRKSVGRRADVQGLRAIAVAIVVLFHAGIALPGGFVGVDVFFVISGFVITQMLLREFSATGTVSFANFFGKRFRRLTPALSVVLLATLVASALLQSPLGEQKVTAATAIGGMLLTANAVIFRTTGGYFEPAAEANPLLHIWSLSVEEQFYVIFPFFLLGVLVLARRMGWRRLPVACLTFVTALSGVIAMLVAFGWELPFHPFLSSYYSPLTRAWEFGAGVLVAVIPALRVPGSRLVAIIASTAGLCMLVLSLWVISHSTPFPGPATLLPVVGTALLLFGGGRMQNPVNTALSSKPFVYLGDISYSWYLWHWPMIVFASTVFPSSPWAKACAAALSLLPAIASYRWIEEPVRDMTGLSKLRFIRLVGLVTAPVILMSGVVLVASSKGWGLEKVQSIQALHPGWSNCMSFATMPNGPSENPSYTGCEWTTTSSNSSTYLVGDSNASQFSSAMIEASHQQGAKFSMRTAGGCPFIDIYRQTGEKFDAPDQLCRDYYELTLNWLERAEKGTVFIASTEGYWFEGNMSIGQSEDGVTSSAEGRATALYAGLYRTVGALQAAGHKVVLVQALPHPTFAGYRDVPTRCSIISLAANNCELAVARAEIEAVQQPSRSAIQRVALSTGASVLDLREHFCNEEMCSMNKNGELLYQDTLHITVETSLSLDAYFTDALTDSAGS